MILGVYGPIKDTDDYKDFSDLIKPEKVNWFMANKNKFTKVSLSVVFSWLRGAEEKRKKQERRKKLSQLNNLEWSELCPMTIDNCANASYKGGVYSLVRKSGSTYEVFYIGQSKTIAQRLLHHMGQEGKFFKRNPCVKEHLEKYDCSFRFVIVEHWATRNKIERGCIEKYKPECNISKGIFKKKKPRLINIIESFLNKEVGYWDFLASDGGRLYCSLVVIGEWDAQVLIIPNTDEGNWRVDKYKEKLRAMAIAQGIKIRNG